MPTRPEAFDAVKPPLANKHRSTMGALTVSLRVLVGPWARPLGASRARWRGCKWSSAERVRVQGAVRSIGRRAGCSSDARRLPVAWLKDFSGRPSWCDAGMALTQIQRVRRPVVRSARCITARVELQGKATGNQFALRIRSWMQMSLFAIGRFIQRFWVVTLVLSLLIMVLLCAALRNATIETDIVKLWVQGEAALSQVGARCWRRQPRRPRDGAEARGDGTAQRAGS